MTNIAIYNHHWATMGGGEVSAGILAETLSKNHHITLLGPTPPNTRLFKTRLNIDISDCTFRQVENDFEASRVSEEFDFFINHSFSSKAQNHSPHGTYIVMFPGNPSRIRSRIKSAVYLPLWKSCQLLGTVSSYFRDIDQKIRLQTTNLQWTRSYQRFLSISDFSSIWTEKLWNQSSELLYPPPSRQVSPGEKKPFILSVGRFFDSKTTHSKQQIEMIKAFRILSQKDGLPDWRLVLAGGCSPNETSYLETVRAAASGLPVEILPNVSGGDLADLLASSSIYWHATGFKQNENKPALFEHFGISIVEAMTAGSVPIVFGAGGPLEIVRHGVDGFHWGTPDELIEKTQLLVNDTNLRTRLSNNAIKRATLFGKNQYEEKVQSLFSFEQERI